MVARKKLRRRMWMRWAVVDDNAIYEITLHSTRRDARKHVTEARAQCLDGRFRAIRATIVQRTKRS